MTTRAEIKAVKPVDFTDTWSPWHHNEVLVAIDNKLDRQGVGVVQEIFELSQDGKDLFATLVLDINGQEHVPSARSFASLGMRNSMKKRFGLGFVGGEQVYVCSNLGFWGDFKEVRRHDSRLDKQAMHLFVDDAIDMVLNDRQQYQAWFADLAMSKVDQTDIKVMAYDAMEKDIVPPSKFNLFNKSLIEEFETQRDYAYPLTAAHFHGGVTRTLRGSGVNKLMQRTRNLNNLIERHTGITLQPGTPVTPRTIADLMI